MSPAFFFDVVAPRIAHEYIRCFVLDLTEKRLQLAIEKDYRRPRTSTTSSSSTTTLSSSTTAGGQEELASAPNGFGRQQRATALKLSPLTNCSLELAVDETHSVKMTPIPSVFTFLASSDLPGQELNLSLVGELLYALKTLPTERFFFPDAVPEASVGQVSLDTIFQRFSSGHPRTLDHLEIFGAETRVP